MSKEEFYKSLRKQTNAELLDKVLCAKGEKGLSDDTIMDLLHISYEDFTYAVNKILEYNKKIERIVIDSSSNDGQDFIAANNTKSFIKDGGFKQGYKDFSLDEIIKNRKAKLLKWQINIFWPLFGISILSLFFSLYALIFK